MIHSSQPLMTYDEPKAPEQKGMPLINFNPEKLGSELS